MLFEWHTLSPSGTADIPSKHVFFIKRDSNETISSSIIFIRSSDQSCPYNGCKMESITQCASKLPSDSYRLEINLDVNKGQVKVGNFSMTDGSSQEVGRSHSIN